MRLLLIIICLLSPLNANANNSYADLVDELMPSVVNISTEKDAVNRDEYIDNMMLNPNLKGREALGSGFFIRDDGHILTNAHVIYGAKKVTVITNDDKSFEAKVVGTDKTSDLAVLKIENPNKEKFHPVKFGNADKSRIGDIVLTFGNPYGLGVSVSQGIISAKSRNIGLSEQQYIQTDAAINQGNSGGPMFDLNGEVIGVNSAIFRESGATGVGFSLPSNIANWISNQLIDNGKVKRGWIGFKVSNGVDRYTEKEGFVITEISEESNAYKEGLRVGDIIISYNDTPATDVAEFIYFTETMDVGQALRLKSLSYGEEIRNVVRIQEMPSKELKNVTNEALKESQIYTLQTNGEEVFYVSEFGITVKEADPKGLVIIKLDKTSPLKKSGISKGDIILQADGSDIYSTDNLLDSIRNAIVEDFRPISILVQGLDNSFYATVELVPEND